MRRIVQHAAVGVTVSILAGAVVAGTLGRTDAATMPAAELRPPAAATGPIGDEAQRIAANSRDESRPGLTGADSEQSAREARRTALSSQQNQISAEHQLLVAERKAAAAKKKAAAEKKKRAAAAKKKLVAKNGGYDPDTTDPKSIAKQIMKNKYGWGADQFSCFNNIIIRESMWDINATNASSGAYGIPQALPGSKMAKFGDDWRTNPGTQIQWGLDYLKSRYGSPCGGWSFKSAHGWY